MPIFKADVLDVIFINHFYKNQDNLIFYCGHDDKQ